MKVYDEAMGLIENEASVQETITYTVYLCRYKGKVFQARDTKLLRKKLEKAITTFRRWGKV